MREFVRRCEVCQRNKTEHLRPGGLLQPLPVPSTVWADIAMDFVEGVPRVSGKSVILTVVDQFSKYAHFMPLAHPYTATLVARVFFDEVVRLHGMPASIVSDRDTVFTSSFWRELFRLSGVKLQYSTAFHPQSDGQSEATNKIIMMYLRCLTGDRPRQWLRWLPWVEYCYNSSYQASLKTSPFRVVYGRDPPTIAAYGLVTPSYRRWSNRCWNVMSSLLRSGIGWSKRSNRPSPSMTRHTGKWSSRWATGCFCGCCIGRRRRSMIHVAEGS